MRPFYFGSSLKPLFGIDDAPQGTAATKGAVLLCYPFGAEYMRSHRAMRELARRLAELGFHVLRFDYFGCGDSSGLASEATLDEWVDNACAALDELREASGIALPSILGLRLGAAVAALALGRGAKADGLVLWDPIVSGRAYLDELEQRHSALIAQRPHPPDYREQSPPAEALGAPLTPTLRRELETLDLRTVSRCAARRALITASEQGEELSSLRAALSRLDIETEATRVAAAAVWVKQDDLDRTLVPREVHDVVVTWIGRGRRS